MTRRHRRRAGPNWAIPCGMALAMATALTACAPDRSYEAPRFPFLARYTSDQTGPQTPAPVLLTNTAWWDGLSDPTLNRLVTLALRDNLSLWRARERVTEAKAARAQVPGAAVLTSSARVRGEGRDNTGSNDTGPNVVGAVELGLSWMLDPVGARREKIRAAAARVDVADAEQDAAALLVLYNMSNAYLDLRYRQRLVLLSERDLSTRQRTLSLTRQLAAAGAATSLEITRARARIAELRAEQPGLRAAVTAARNQIAVLAGSAPGTLPPDLNAALNRNPTRGQSGPGLSPRVGIPADLMRNRPDIRIAERRYYAALADIGAARGQLYPRLSLTGAITANALEGSGTDYFLGPVLQLPDLPLGPTRALVAQRESAARQAHATWHETTLTALLEVENALVEYGAVSASTAAAAEAVRLYREALSLTRRIYERGEATLGDLVDAEEAISAADRQLARLQYERGLAFVALNVRVGAGHNTGRPPARAKTESTAESTVESRAGRGTGRG